MRKVQAEVVAGAYVEPKRLSLAAYLDDWLGRVRAQIRGSTFIGYAKAVERAKAALGAIELQRLTKPQVEAFYAGLRERGNERTGGQLAYQSVANVHIAIRRALGDAMEDGLLVRNPAAGAFRLQAERHEMRTWTAAELARFLRVANGERLGAAFRVAAMSGVRRGELLALRWRDVDLDAATVAVRRQLVRLPDRSYGFGDTKTGKSRTVALDADTIAELRRHRARQAEERLSWGADYKDHDLLFCREDGTPINGDVIEWAFKRVTRRAGVPRIRFHDLRHTAATLRLSAGVHPKIVQELLGHANIAVTMDIYSHALPSLQAESAEKVAELLREVG
jgi:integrase